MPPTQKSASTKSAHNESDAIGIQDVYYLSDYAFQIQRNSVASSTYDQITAVCTNKDGKNARQAIQLPSSTKLKNWYVEANEDTASVYAVVMVPTGESSEHQSSIDVRILPQAEGYPMPIPTGNSIVYKSKDHEIGPGWPERTQTTTGMLYICVTPTSIMWGIASKEPGTVTYITDYDQRVVEKTENLTSQRTLLGTEYYHQSRSYSVANDEYWDVSGVFYGSDDLHADRRVIETILIDGVTIPVNPEYEEKEILVGRFAIEFEDAGGVGPGSDWGDPGDWDEDWEEGDPTQTLHVEVIGALSGRHNDPIEDPSYSYIPADKETVKDYGCGGDGGHGGGGGAGASTVVVYKFATNQADGKEIVALAKRHGYGSGGGKGGKGGDGCILVYY